MAGIEETLARRNHFLAIAGVERALFLYRQQVDIALTGDVETMTDGAAPCRILALQTGTIQRAGQRLKWSDAHDRCVLIAKMITGKTGRMVSKMTFCIG
jgi:hypothetical protein